MEQDKREVITYHVRIFPIDAITADQLLAKLQGFVKSKRQLPNSSDYNIIVSADPHADLDVLADILESSGLEGKFDIFISLVPASYSIIKEVPDQVVKLIARLKCRLYVSFTAGF